MKRDKEMERSFEITDEDSIEEMERKVKLAEMYYAMKDSQGMGCGFWFMVIGSIMITIAMIGQLIESWM